jgi:DNA-binding winged helix-turn-helix (wHTH) protein
VLRALVANSGRHLDHEQMIRQAWDSAIVSKHTVTVTVGEVKKALGEFSGWIRCHPRLGYCLEVPESEELLRTGWHFLNRHTREGLEKAIDCFEQAARRDGAEIRALEGISLAHLLLGSHGMRPPREMYSRFLSAYRRVVEIRGLTPNLRVGRAFGLHIFERRFADAEALLLEAELERPNDVVGYVRLAMLYVAWKRMDDAVKTLAKARAADALSPIFAMAEILVRFCRRDYEGAVAYGKKVLDLHPYLHQVMTFYANALEFFGPSGRSTRTVPAGLHPGIRPSLASRHGSDLPGQSRTDWRGGENSPGTALEAAD